MESRTDRYRSPPEAGLSGGSKDQNLITIEEHHRRLCEAHYAWMRATQTKSLSSIDVSAVAQLNIATRRIQSLERQLSLLHTLLPYPDLLTMNNDQLRNRITTCVLAYQPETIVESKHD